MCWASCKPAMGVRTAESPTCCRPSSGAGTPSIRRVVRWAGSARRNLEALLNSPGVETPGFVLAVPGRRYRECRSVAPFLKRLCRGPEESSVSCRGAALCGARGKARKERIQSLEDRPPLGEGTRGKRIAAPKRASSAGRSLGDFRVDLKRVVCLDINPLWRSRIDGGKLLLVTNTADLSPRNVVDRYKALADIERGPGAEIRVESAVFAPRACPASCPDPLRVMRQRQGRR